MLAHRMSHAADRATIVARYEIARRGRLIS
jgi:hypothetical protein